MFPIRCAVAVIIFLLETNLPCAHAAQAKWSCVSAGEVEVCADGDPARAVEALSILLETGAIVAQDIGLMRARPAPLKVLLYESSRVISKFRGSDQTKGFFVAGGDADFIFLTTAEPAWKRAARHEMVHRHLHRFAGPLPQWVDEGVAEYYSTLEAAGRRATVGAAIEHHVKGLERLPRFTGREFFGILDTAELRNPPERMASYYAHAWALVHFLRTGPGEEDRFAKLLNELAQGVTSEVALQQAYGQSPGKLLASAIGHVRQPVLPKRLFDAPRPGRFEAPREMSPEDSLAWESEALFAAGLRDEATPMLEQLRQLSSRKARAAGHLGLLALREGNLGKARAELSRAIALDSRDAVVWFEYAILMDADPASRQEVERCLRRVVELAPSYAEAWLLLARQAERRNDIRDALECARRATALDPRQASYWESVALLEWKLGQRNEALASARNAAAAARRRAQRAQIEGLIRELETPPAVAKAPDRPAVITPESWFIAPAPASVQGEIVRIDCLETGLRFHLRTAKGILVLSASGPDKIRTTGAPASFTCGPQVGSRRVLAEYALPGTLIRLSYQ